MDIFLHSAIPYLLEKALGPVLAGEPMLVNQSEAKATFDSPRLANPCGGLTNELLVAALIWPDCGLLDLHQELDVGLRALHLLKQ